MTYATQQFLIRLGIRWIAANTIQMMLLEAWWKWGYRYFDAMPAAGYMPLSNDPILEFGARMVTNFLTSDYLVHGIVLLWTVWGWDHDQTR